MIVSQSNILKFINYSDKLCKYKKKKSNFNIFAKFVNFANESCVKKLGNVSIASYIKFHTNYNKAWKD
ncbi:MAG: hypothetical protein OHK0057_31390 [Thermoflexibacter sp.]